jgi:hypothetical protein
MFLEFITRPRCWLVLFIIPLFLSACVAGGAEPAIPLPKGIPNDDIVFMPPTSDPVHADDVVNDKKTVGFINDDGTGEVDYTFKIYQGAGSNFGAPIYVQQAVYPRWSQSGSKVAFSVRGAPPNIRLIDSDGRMYGKKCDALREFSTFDSQGNILGAIDKYSPVLLTKYQNKITANTSLIARYDLKTCKVDEFSIPIPQNTYPQKISETESGLVTAEYFKGGYNYMIIIYNSKTKASSSFAGFDPSPSKDGTLLAYYNYSGDLVVRNIESGLEKSIINVLPTNHIGFEHSDFDFLYMPGWSPDKKWLVYNTMDGYIFKVNIETGKSILITFGWAPDWRP